MRRVPGLVLLVIGLGTLTPPAHAQKPLDPGAVALLADVPDHGADGELRQALLDANPLVRQVAARAIGVGGHRELLANLIGALLREQDRATGPELVRDALYLAGDTDQALIAQQAKRFGSEAAAVQAELVGRTHPERFVASLGTWAADPDEVHLGLARLVHMVATQNPGIRDDVFAAWLAAAPKDEWRELLNLTYGSLGSLAAAAPVLKTALSSPRDSVREESVWFLVRALSIKQETPADLLDKALPAQSDAAISWEQFGRELIARRRTKAPTPDRSAFLAAEGERHRARFALQDYPDLTKAEHDTLFPPGTDRPGRSDATIGGTSAVSAMRTLDTFAPRLAAATVAAAGCKPPSGTLGAALLWYSPDGRPRKIEIGGAGLPDPCVKAITALARLTVAESDYPALDSADVTALPLHAAFLSCVPRVRPPDSTRRPPGPGVIRQPRKLRDAKPFYPEDAIRQRIEGVVILEAVISDQGCISSARVLRSIPPLDIAALWAVTQWVFEPTLLDGNAVPVIMTVNVNFRLQQ